MQDRGVPMLLRLAEKSKNDSIVSRGIIRLNGMKGLVSAEKR